MTNKPQVKEEDWINAGHNEQVPGLVYQVSEHGLRIIHSNRRDSNITVSSYVVWNGTQWSFPSYATERQVDNDYHLQKWVMLFRERFPYSNTKKTTNHRKYPQRHKQTTRPIRR